CAFCFFQAEDGIRDFHVTGVQTCALPISSYGSTLLPYAARTVSIASVSDVLRCPPGRSRIPVMSSPTLMDVRSKGSDCVVSQRKIGRASGRERVERVGAAVSDRKATAGVE